MIVNCSKHHECMGLGNLLTWISLRELQLKVLWGGRSSSVINATDFNSNSISELKETHQEMSGEEMHERYANFHHSESPEYSLLTCRKRESPQQWGGGWRWWRPPGRWRGWPWPWCPSVPPLSWGTRGCHHSSCSPPECAPNNHSQCNTVSQ